MWHLFFSWIDIDDYSYPPPSIKPVAISSAHCASVFNIGKTQCLCVLNKKALAEVRS